MFVSTNKDFSSASILCSGRATNPYQLAVLTLLPSRVPRYDHARWEGNARILRGGSTVPAGILLTEEQPRDNAAFILRRRIALQKLRVLHLIKKFRAFYGTRSSITACYSYLLHRQNVFFTRHAVTAAHTTWPVFLMNQTRQCYKTSFNVSLFINTPNAVHLTAVGAITIYQRTAKVTLLTHTACVLN